MGFLHVVTLGIPLMAAPPAPAKKKALTMPALDDEVVTMLESLPASAKYVLPGWCVLEGVRARPMTRADVESVGSGTTTGVRLVDCTHSPDKAAKCRSEIAQAICKLDTIGVAREW